MLEPQQGATYDQQLAIAQAAEGAGFDGFFRSDHLMRFDQEDPGPGPTESWVTLAGIARETSRIRLGTMVTSMTFRFPGMLAVEVAQVDDMSGGRVELGLGAGWFDPEHHAHAVPFPPLGQRFEMLEETLQMANQMWSGGRGSEGRHEGKQFIATRLLNSPQAISRPRVPIMIGGGGEQKTLRLVAQYADATNVFGGPDRIRHKYAVLREHCDRLGRPYDEIERSTLQGIDLERDSPAQVVDWFGQLGDAGAQHVIASVRGVASLTPLERIGAEVIPQLRS